jgi:hypothetical protein
VIIAGRYGSTSTGGLSYTQMEYEYAVTTGKPVIAFLQKDPEKIPKGKSEATPEGLKKLSEFRALAQQKMCKFWESPADLGAAVSRSLVKLIKNKPATGWVKADLLPDETTLMDMLRLRERVEYLQEQLSIANKAFLLNTEDLAQGNDRLSISYYCFIKNNSIGITHQVGPEKLTTTWDILFMIIAPYIIEKKIESEISDILSKRIKEKYSDIFGKIKLKEFDYFYGIKLTDESYQMMLIQYYALGFIERHPNFYDDGTVDIYWKLTELGHKYLLSSCAIRRKQKDDTKPDQDSQMVSM